MKLARFQIVIAILFGIAIGAFGVDVVFVDGVVDGRYADGQTVELFIGDVVKNGDTVLTGKNAYADRGTRGRQSHSHFAGYGLHRARN